MTGQKIRADFEELTSIAAKWGEQRDRVLASKNNLQTRMNTLRNGDWEGDSAEVFYAEMDSVVMPALGRLVAALDDAAHTTLGIREVMAQAELDVAAIFKEREEGSAGKGKGLAKSEDFPFLPPMPPVFWKMLLRHVSDLANDLYAIYTTKPIPPPESRPNPESTDLTDWIIDRMKEAMSSEDRLVVQKMWQNGSWKDALKSWVAHVRQGATWDYKTVLSDLKKYGKGYVNDPHKTIFFAGHEVSYQALANMTYGYYGASVGLPEELLRAGAGAFQVKDNPPKTQGPFKEGETYFYFDDPHDRWWIDFGVELYKEYPDINTITPESLSTFYDDYAAKNGSWPEPLDWKNP